MYKRQALLVFCIFTGQKLHKGYLLLMLVDPTATNPLRNKFHVATKPALLFVTVIIHEIFIYPEYEVYVVEPGADENCRSPFPYKRDCSVTANPARSVAE